DVCSSDLVTGPAMGRPRSATFRTLDLVGIDVFKMVADNLHTAAPEQWERDAFAVPPVIDALIERGALGEKTRQGFYKREKVDGETQILVMRSRRRWSTCRGGGWTRRR